MSKALKIVGTIVAVVAIAATAVATFGASLGISATLVATAAAVASYAAIAAGVIGLAASFVKPPGFTRSGNPLAFSTNPQSGLPIGFGRTRMSGLRIHGETTDGFADKVQNDVLGFAVLLSAGGNIEGIDSFKADKAAVTFNSGTGQAVGSYNGFMSQKVSLGGSTALSLTLGSGSMPGWTSAHKLSGMAHALWMLRFDSKGEFYQAGVPEPEWIGRWTKVYDPRLDSTYPGGSGSCRAGVESTYVWSRNGALQALTWAIGRFQNGKRTVGIGAPVANIRVADFVEAANVADENEWYSGGFYYSTDSKWDVLKGLLQAAGAIPTQTSAMIGCMVNAPRVPVTTISSEHLIDQLSIAVTKSRRDKFNVAIPRYRSEAHEFEIISGSPITSATYVTDDGREISREVDLPMVQHELVDDVDGNRQAGQLAAYAMVNAREAGPISLTTGPEFIGIKSGDCVTLNVPEEGLVNQDVIIKSTSLNVANATISFVAETETEAKHAFALGKTTTPPPPFTLSPASLIPDAPAVALWSAAPTLTADGQPSITVTGASEYTTGVDVLVRYRENGATDWFVPAIYADPRGTVKHVIGPLDSETDYDVEVSYRNGTIEGPWRALGPVTTLEGSLAAAVAALATLDDDDVLTVDEKIRILIPRAAALESMYQALFTLATARGISTSAVTAARSAWLAILAGVTPDWDDTTAPSPVSRNSFDLALNDYADELEQLNALIRGEPGASAFTLVSVANVDFPTPTSVRKTGGGSAWNGKAQSVQSGPAILITAKAATSGTGWGITTDPAVDSHYTSVDYWLNLGGDGNVYRYRNGGSPILIGNWAAGDYFGVGSDGKVVRYFKNGALMDSHDANTIGETLFAVVNMLDVGLVVEEISVTLGGTSPPLITLSTTHKTFRYDGDDVPLAQETTLKAKRQNTDGVTQWRYLDASGTPQTTWLSGAGMVAALGADSSPDNDTLILDEARFDANIDAYGSTGIIVEARISTATDIQARESLVKVRDGSTGSDGAPAFIVTPSVPAIAFATNSAEVIDPSSQLPFAIQFTAKLGDVDVTSSATWGAPSVTNCAVTNSGGGAYSLTSASARTGFFTVPVTYLGYSFSITIPYTKNPAGPASTRVRDSTLTNTASATFVQVSDTLTINFPPGTTMTFSMSDGYIPVTGSADNATARKKARFMYRNLTDGGSWTQAGSDLTGSYAIADYIIFPDEPEFIPGDVSGSYDGLTAPSSNKVYEVRLDMLKDGSASLDAFGGIFEVTIS